MTKIPIVFFLHFLCLSPSLSLALYLILATTMMMVRLASPFVCLLAQTNALISSDPGVSLCKLLFIKRIDSTAAGIKNTCFYREIKSMFLMKRFCTSSSVYVCKGKYCRRLELRWSQYSPLLIWGIILCISFQTDRKLQLLSLSEVKIFMTRILEHVQRRRPKQRASRVN